jgi:hypothetical protein
MMPRSKRSDSIYKVEMGIFFIRTIMISLAVAYLALTHHIFEEKVVLSFLLEHMIAIGIGLLIAILFYVYSPSKN